MENIKKQNSKKKNKKDYAIKIIKKIAIVISFVLNAFFIFSLLLGSCSNNSKKASADNVEENYFLPYYEAYYSVIDILNDSSTNLTIVADFVTYFNSINDWKETPFLLDESRLVCDGVRFDLYNIYRLSWGIVNNKYIFIGETFNHSTIQSNEFYTFEGLLKFLPNVPYVAPPTNSRCSFFSRDTSWNQFIYYLPPYINISVNTDSFVFENTFIINNVYYKKIEYLKGQYFQFYSWDNLNVLRFKGVLSKDKINYCFSNYDLENVSSLLDRSIPFISFINISTECKTFFDSYFIPSTNRFINGSFFLNFDYLDNLCYYSYFNHFNNVEGVSGSPHIVNLSFDYQFQYGDYICNNVILRFESTYIATLSGETTYSHKVSVIFIRAIDLFELEICSCYNYWSLQSGDYKHFSISIPLIENIKLYNVPYSKQVYNSISCLFLPYSINPNNVNYNNPLDSTFNIFASLFGSITNMLNVQVYSNITLLGLLLCPLIIMLILSIIKLLRG